MKKITDAINRYEEELKIMQNTSFRARSRCFAVTIRDRPELHALYTEAEARIIGQGNQAVHQGDALLDSLMYQKSFRIDTDMFAWAYGLEWQEVRTIRE